MDIHQKISSPLALTLIIVLALAFIDVVLLFNDVPDAFISTSYANTTPVYLGKGCTTAYYIDKDCDGYGVGKRSSGNYSGIGVGDMPDADDNDPNVNTPQSISNLQDFLTNVKGYNPLRIFYIAATGANNTSGGPDGNDATGAVNNINSPYASWGKVKTLLQPGDILIYRKGMYTEKIDCTWPALRGTEANPIVIMAYPGERVVIDRAGNAIVASASDNNNDSHWLTFDGFNLDNTAVPGGDIGVLVGGAHDITIRNFDIRNHYWGIKGMNSIDSLVIENSVIHDNPAEHGIYLGANAGGPNQDITIRGNILYYNNRHGFQHNGTVTGLLIENNIIHSNAMGGISLLRGVSYSTIRNNLIFNNVKQGIVFYNYDEPGLPSPLPQIHNIVENNTIWIGRYSWNGVSSGPAEYPAVSFNNDSVGQVGEMDFNVFRNNIFVTYNGQVFNFTQQSYAETTTIENNLFYRVNGQGRIMTYGLDTYDMSGFNIFSLLFQNNQFADPLFTHALIDDYTNSELFNFDLLSTSPAINFGITTGAPTTDLRGYTRDSHPDAGAYEYQGSTPPPPPPVTIYGDVNNDSSVTLSDALLVAQYAVGLTTLNSTQITKADVSGNNAVTAHDASLILQKILGLISKFPVE